MRYKYTGDKMKKSILIGISIITVAGIILAAVAMGFGDTRTKVNSSVQINEPFTKEAEALAETGISQIDIKGEIQYAQSNVSFRIIEPMYIPDGYEFETVEGKKFRGASIDLDMASFSYKNGDEQLTIKETILIKNIQNTEQSTSFQDTREIVDINGIEGRYSQENGIKSLGWKIGNLSLSIRNWKNEGQNQTSSSLGKEEMINIAKSVREKTPGEAIAEAQEKVSFRILQPSYIPEGYRMNTAQTTGTRFRGTSVELEQSSIFYIKGDEFFAENEYLNLKELLTIKEDTDTEASERTSNIPWKYVDINGVQGRFLEEQSGVKSLNWKIGDLSLTIGSHAYNESGFTGTSLSMEEMIKMARSVK